MKHGYVGSDVTVVAHATVENVRGMEVYGVIPLHLAAVALSVNAIDLPDMPADRRGTELSCEDMERFGAVCTRYVVQKG